MATSGTVGATAFNVAKIIEHAYRRCGVSSSELTSEKLMIGRDALFFYLSSLANRGISLWTIERQILGTYPYTREVTFPTGTIDVLNANYRTLTQVTGGTAASSAGGTAANAFDADVDTYCQQTSANGNISYDYGAAGDPITSIGVLPYGSQSLTPVLEYTMDGSTWSTLYTPEPDGGATTISMTDKAWVWWDIPIPQAAQGYRIRETGGATMALREFYLGNSPSEVPLSRLNRDDYSALPNKASSGTPTQFWVDRQLNGPVMNLWPTPDGYFKQVVAYTHRHVQDPGLFTNTMEFPQRWTEALVYNTAARISMELPDLPDQRISMLDQAAVRADKEAADEERDDSPIYLYPAIGVYQV